MDRAKEQQRKMRAEIAARDSNRGGTTEVTKTVARRGVFTFDWFFKDKPMRSTILVVASYRCTVLVLLYVPGSSNVVLPEEQNKQQGNNLLVG